MNETDTERLRHMLDAARAAQRFVQGKTRASLDSDQLLEFGLRQALEIIGEAASKISSETREQNPQFAWKEMIGMRNVLIHGYMFVDLSRVWNAVTEDIPPLIAQLEAILPPENPA